MNARILIPLLVLAHGCAGNPEPHGPRTSRAAAPSGQQVRAVATPLAATADSDSTVVAARIFAFADSQFHYQFGKRTFAQSPFAERMSFEVAVRPTALDESSDLLLAIFLDAYRSRYQQHSLVFLGDAADLSCTQEMDAFVQVVRAAGIDHVMAVASNHDGFYAGNFTSKKDADGMMALTDMPRDWTRACGSPDGPGDYRLTKGRAVAALHKLLPESDRWATEVAASGRGPTDYRDAYLYYVRPLSGGDAGAPPVYGVFLDTVDYRGFDFEESNGAGGTAAISRAQLAFLDKAMFEATIASQATGQPVTFVLFGHHPLRDLESASSRRVQRFLASHTNIVAYVTAHKHKSMERHVPLPDGRRLPELIVGSTTDAPQGARVIEVRVDVANEKRSVDSQRLVLDTDELCADVAPMDADTSGYVGYRILRDGVPGLTLNMLEKLLFLARLTDLGQKRALQTLGALLMENELVRSWARLYRDAPIALPERERRQLDGILARRYAAGQNGDDLRPYFDGSAPVPATDTAGYDPVIAKIMSVAEHGVHRFARHRRLIEALRRQRTSSPAAHRYFTCHAVYAARAERKTYRARGNVLYIR